MHQAQYWVSIVPSTAAIEPLVQWLVTVMLMMMVMTKMLCRTQTHRDSLKTTGTMVHRTTLTPTPHWLSSPAGCFSNEDSYPTTTRPRSSPGPHNNNNNKLSYRRDSARCGWNGYSRSLKVIRCYANRRGIYDFLAALNSNLTCLQLFLRYHAWFAHLYPTCLPGGTGKRWLAVGRDALAQGYPEYWTIQP